MILCDESHNILLSSLSYEFASINTYNKPTNLLSELSEIRGLISYMLS